MEMEDILAFKKLTASITGNDINNISGNTLSEVIDNCVMTVVLKDGNEASKVNYVKFNDYLINPETGTFYTVAGDNFDYWQVVSADTNQESCKCYNRSFDMRITKSCSIVAVYKGQETMLTVSLKDGNSSIIQAIVSNGELLTDESNNFYQATGENFAYWSVFTSDDGKEVSRCYYKSFNLRIYDNYTIVAVYNVEPKSLISISKHRYSREQSTNEEGTVVKDTLYADFIVAYMNQSHTMITENPDKYHTGIIIEVDAQAKITVGVDGKPSNYKDVEFKSVNIRDCATGTGTGADIKADGYTNVVTIDDGDGNSHKRIIYKHEIDNTKYNNFNRLDYFVSFKNSSANRLFVMKATYYVYYYDDNGDIVYEESQPVYFNLYEVGTSTPTTVTTNS